MKDTNIKKKKNSCFASTVLTDKKNINYMIDKNYTINNNEKNEKKYRPAHVCLYRPPSSCPFSKQSKSLQTPTFMSCMYPLTNHSISYN